MKQSKGAVRNGFIDIQRFFYSWIIVLLHFYIYTREHFKGGGTSVEFFLIVSGAFFFAGYEKKAKQLSNEELLSYPTRYIYKRLLRFLPYTVPAIAFAFFVDYAMTDKGIGFNSLSTIIDSFVRHIWDIPLISMCGLNADKAMIDGVIWTISAMLIVEFLILNLLVRMEKTFCSFLAPAAILAGCGFWTHIKDTNHVIWHGFTTFGVIRVFIMLCIGIYVWKGSRCLAKIKFTNRGRAILTVIELSLHIIAVISMMYRNTRYYRMFLAVLFAVAITITISCQSYTTRWFRQSAVTDFLGEWSMTIYVVHLPIRNLLYKFCETPYELYRLKYIYGALVIAVSLALLFFARYIKRTAPKTAAGVRSFFVNEGVNP